LNIHNPFQHSMNNAPAVSYPVGRSNFHGWMLGLVSLAGLLAGLLWRFQADPPMWRQGLFVATLLATGLAALQAWRHSPCGSLKWDGQGWSLTVPGATFCGLPTVHLDLQWCLLLRLRTENDSCHWLWLERQGDVAPWNALRRALFSASAAGQGPEAGVDVHRPEVSS
jgi:hypothetical protein